MSRLLVSSGSPYEKSVGYSRAVRVGNWISVAGTTAASGDKPVAVGDPEAQTRAIFETIDKALQDAGSSLRDVVRTTVYLVDIKHFDAMAKVHGEVFADIRPANTTLEVSGFVSPDWLVEIAVDAVVPEVSE